MTAWKNPAPVESNDIGMLNAVSGLTTMRTGGVWITAASAVSAFVEFGVVAINCTPAGADGMVHDAKPFPSAFVVRLVGFTELPFVGVRMTGRPPERLPNLSKDLTCRA